MSGINVVLVEPEIPPNTGNIARTCAAVGARLHLVKPLGFFLRDRHLRRAGADYWSRVDLVVHESWEAFEAARAGANLCFFTRRAERSYLLAPFENEPFLIFGRESTGLSEALLAGREDRCFRIPMRPAIRSLNLAEAVSIVLYEAFRVRGFPGLG